MRGMLRCVSALAVCGCLYGAAGAQTLHPTDLQETGKVDGVAVPIRGSALAKVDLRYYWVMRTGLDLGEKLTRLYRVGEDLYCLTSRNRLIAVDARRGLPKWSQEIGAVVERVFRPIHFDDLAMSEKQPKVKHLLRPDLAPSIKPFNAVILNTVHSIIVINRTTGRRVRRIRLDFPASCGGNTDGKMYYVGAVDGLYHAVELQAGLKIWSMYTKGLITAPVEYYNNLVYVASQDGTLYVCRPATKKGKTLWRQEIGTPITTAFSVGRRGCFVPCEDGRVYAFDAISGQAIQTWQDRFVTHGALQHPVQMAKRTLFQYSHTDAFYAVEITSGKKRWSLRDGRLVVALIKGNVHMLDKRRTLWIIDEMLGEVKGKIRMSAFDLFLPNASLDVIFAARASGEIFCLRHQSAGHLTPDMLAPGASARAAAAKRAEAAAKRKKIVKPKPPAAP